MDVLSLLGGYTAGVYGAVSVINQSLDQAGLEGTWRKTLSILLALFGSLVVVAASPDAYAFFVEAGMPVPAAIAVAAGGVFGGSKFTHYIVEFVHLNRNLKQSETKNMSAQAAKSEMDAAQLRRRVTNAQLADYRTTFQPHAQGRFDG